jgi:hypothetical protein
MNGEAPVAIPMTFENTKFPSVAEKIKNLVTSREEALAAHELARSRMAERIKSNFDPFKEGQMVWLDLRHLKTNYHKKMAPKREGPLIGMKNDIPWIIKFFIYYISNQNPILLTTGAVRIKSADYTC